MKKHIDQASEIPERMPSVAAVVPAYRTAPHIQSVLSGIPRYVEHIVVVDDCSPDNSADIVRKGDDSRVHLVRNARNEGVGGAMLAGYDMALGLGAEIIV